MASTSTDLSKDSNDQKQQLDQVQVTTQLSKQVTTTTSPDVQVEETIVERHVMKCSRPRMGIYIIDYALVF